MIRVLRLLEYRYWGIGANATYRANSHVTIASSIMVVPESVPDEPVADGVTQ